MQENEDQIDKNGISAWAKPRRRRYIRKFAALFTAFYILPIAIAAGLWFAQERPMNWRAANWSSSGLLAAPKPEDPAEIMVLAARTGHVKGILSVHSWLLVKPKGAKAYTRYDVVGWGNPVRKDAYAADARWYSNDPEIIGAVRGEAAEQLIPKIERVIAQYPHAQRGSYRIWPGPNSNSFVAHILHAVPELGINLPPTAIGKDYLAGGALWSPIDGGRGFKLSLGGIVSFTAGLYQGLELNLFGLVAGVDIRHPAIKLPGLGRIGVDRPLA